MRQDLYKLGFIACSMAPIRANGVVIETASVLVQKKIGKAGLLA